MNPREFVRLAQRLMACPAAPFHEAGVRAVVEVIGAENGLDCRRDRFGNVIVRLGSAAVGRPLVLAAHMDHPGFEIVRSLGEGRWRARFNGGVPDSYFRPGIPLRLLPGAAPARLGKRLEKTKEFEIHATGGFRGRRHELADFYPTGRGLVTSAATGPRFAVWELEDFAVRAGKIHGRSCDDLV